jgi:hypothetical protein
VYELTTPCERRPADRSAQDLGYVHFVAVSSKSTSTTGLPILGEEKPDTIGWMRSEEMRADEIRMAISQQRK